ncbi:hemerythrin domain-containing protein [Actinoallomurus sp. NBC_01490]|uniref:hemerythrin domain-containing protein n=1 Tax=Actinoallomurus sp. NBC_01490 TaxID=2903557 RepID=UPI002E32C631|nr:hemerythrin domain-containing protein [Actinoallomurus sp. NBC_01490]
MTDQIDFTMMYVTHDAFRRDLVRLEAAVADGRAVTQEVREGWDNFTAQLHVHHAVEDEWLWPRLAELAGDRPGAPALLAEMEAEHARLDPLLEELGGALEANAADLAERVETLTTVLDRHLEHEEDEALPLIQEVMTPADWKEFGSAMARRQGVKGAAAYVPWIIDGMSRADRRRFLAHLPAPVRAINRLAWTPRYRRRRLWNPTGTGSLKKAA